MLLLLSFLVASFIPDEVRAETDVLAFLEILQLVLLLLLLREIYDRVDLLLVLNQVSNHCVLQIASGSLRASALIRAHELDLVDVALDDILNARHHLRYLEHSDEHLELRVL